MAALTARGPVQAGLSDSSETRGIAGLERMAQTDVRQNAADYNRRPANWKDLLLLMRNLNGTELNHAPCGGLLHP